MYSTYKPIKSWAVEDRPREKLLTKGKRALTNSELIAIILGSGTHDSSAIDVAKLILNHFDNDLNLLAKSSVNELKRFKGIGPVKAITLTAALELGRRKQTSKGKILPQISSSHDAYIHLKPFFDDQTVEYFYVGLLNQNNRLLNIVQISKGGIAGTVVDPKIIFKQALENRAVSIILAHNHPSGNMKPSQADITITKKLIQAGKTLDIKIVDHLILTDFGYVSFLDEGWL